MEVYERQILEHIQWEILQDEKEEKLESDSLHRDEIKGDMNKQLLDMCSSNTRDTKYFKIVTLYQKMKALIAKAWLQNHATNIGILQQLNISKNQDAKLIVVAYIACGVWFMEDAPISSCDTKVLPISILDDK